MYCSPAAATAAASDSTAGAPAAAAAASAGAEVSYGEHIAPLRAAAGPGMRCVLVSATLPQHTFDELQDLFVDLGAAFGPGLTEQPQVGQMSCIPAMADKKLGLQDKTAGTQADAAACNLSRNSAGVLRC